MCIAYIESINHFAFKFYFDFTGPEKYKGRRSKRRIQPCVCPFFKASIIVLTCAGKGDKFVCPSPGDSEGERKNSGVCLGENILDLYLYTCNKKEIA